MANYEDMLSMETAKWAELLTKYDISFSKENFSENYAIQLESKINKNMSFAAAKAAFEELVRADAKVAACKAIYYAIFYLMEKNPVEFISIDELTIEFRDLLKQAENYELQLPTHIASLNGANR